ncbi:hypothetical protein DVK02_14975 [Halobellus sp. Atlit-31R]|nr:hypothetical protein DVK02_14975 [Halobellus sp. Atlit-31R]
MGQLDRLIVVFVLFGSATVLALLHVRVFLPFIELAQTDFSGPFTPVVELIPTVVPAIVGGLYLFGALYLIIGPVQKEKSQQIVRRRP